MTPSTTFFEHRIAVTPYLSANRPLRLTTLCVLYVSQGMPDGFVRTGLKTYLIDKGTSTQDIANLIALVSWPWAVKWIWGPVIDSFSHSPLGRRRPWILSAQFGMGLAMGSMLLIPDLEANLWLLGVMILVINTFSSMQDVAIDALAIDVLPEKERGVANGFMFGSAQAGTLIGGAILGGLLLHRGISSAVLLEICVLAIIAVFPLIIRERPGDRLLPGLRGGRLNNEEKPPILASMAATLGQLKTAFARRSSLMAGLLAVCSLATTSAYLVFWPVHVVRVLGWSKESYVALEGWYAVLFGLVGCVVGGIISSWLGARFSVLVAIGSLAGCWLAYAASANFWDSSALIFSLFVTVSFLSGFFQVSMFALFMGVCSQAVAATQFSAYMAFLNVSSGFGSKLAGYVGEQQELTNVFIGLACFQLLMIPIVLSIGTSKATKINDPPEAPNKV